VIAGAWINTPFGAGNQDHFGVSGQVGVGASGYGAGTNMASPAIFGTGNQVTIGAMSDAVFVNGSSIQMTTSWAAVASYEHWFSPTVRVTPFGGFSQVSYNNTVKSGRWFCGGGANGTAAIGAQNILVAPTTACDPGYSVWQVGAHADWYPVKNLRFGLEAVWTGVDTAMGGQVVTLAKSIGARPTGVYTAKDLGVLTTAFRAQRNF